MHSFDEPRHTVVNPRAALTSRVFEHAFVRLNLVSLLDSAKIYSHFTRFFSAPFPKDM